MYFLEKYIHMVGFLIIENSNFCCTMGLAINLAGKEINCGGKMSSINVNALTIVALVYWSVTALWAGFRGMIRTVLSFLVIILTIVVTYVGTPAVYQSLYGSANVRTSITQNSGVIIDNLAESIASGNDSSGWLEVLPLPEEAQQIIALGDKDMIAQVIRSETVKQYLTAELANFIIRVISAVATALVTFIVLTVIRFVLLRMADLPGVSALDHFLGFLIGLIKGIVVIWIVLFVIRLISLTGNGTVLMDQIRDSEVLTVLDEYNMFRTIIMSLMAGF